MRVGEPAEIASAEAWAAGAVGVEEQSASEGFTVLVLYATRATAASVRDAVAALSGTRVGAPQPVANTDWSEAWREGLTALVIGERLVVRPSWVEPVPGEHAEVVIDPGQAFGTGAHVSTHLVLEWLEALASTSEGLGRESRVLDVGAGSGVLALASVALGAAEAVGFDLDPESGRAAREATETNGAVAQARFFVGPIEAIDGPPFDWVLANLLKREVLPLKAAIATRTRPGGHAVLSGLLAREEDEVVAAFESEGLVRAGARTARDPNGDEWVSLLFQRLRRG